MSKSQKKKKKLGFVLVRHVTSYFSQGVRDMQTFVLFFYITIIIYLYRDNSHSITHEILFSSMTQSLRKE